MDPSIKLAQAEGLVFRVIGEDGIIYSPDTKRLHILNKTALLAWNLWDGEHTLADIADMVMAEYEADSERVINDIVRCANELCRHGLLSDAQSDKQGT